MKKIIALIIAALMLLNAFPSFAAGDVIQSATPLLSALNIMVGDTNGNLRLDSYVSRAEFTKVAVASSSSRHSVATSLKTSSYKDVHATHWAAPYIKVGVGSGYCKGYSDATFRPDNTVTYEEAITILLRVLGYSDDDFGNSWPYGQVGMAKNLGICDGVDAEVGDALIRKDVAILVYNTLNTKMKNSTQILLSIFDVEKKEDVLLTAINEKENSYEDEVRTSVGTFKFESAISVADIGRQGDLYIENGNEVLAFIPYGGSAFAEKHTVYSLLGESVVTYNNGAMNTLTVPSNTTVYEDDSVTNYAVKSPQIEMGDILYIHRDRVGNIENIIFEDGTVDGPYTVTSSYNLSKYSGAKVMRNGEASSVDEIQNYDVVYYIPDLNMLMSYSNKVTGIYENAEPNKDAPTSVTVSGISYKIESGEAFEKMSSAGKFNYGDTVTLLLGKTNEVADVFTSINTNETIYGYLFETGKKEFTRSDLSKYTSHYIKVAIPDGSAVEYATDKDYDNLINSVLEIRFKDGIAKPSRLNAKYDVSTTFDWSGKTLGTNTISSDVKIIDVATTEENEYGSYVSVFPSRLDGVNIPSSSVLYMGKNDKNQINELILKDVTGDVYSYAVVMEADVRTGNRISGSYTYDLNGVTHSLNSTNVIYNVKKGQAAKISFNKNGVIQSMQAITAITDKITDISHTTLTAGGKKYPISDSVVVYKTDLNYNYTVIPLSDIMDNDDYSLTAYYDKNGAAGGQIRIIVAR